MSLKAFTLKYTVYKYENLSKLSNWQRSVYGTKDEGNLLVLVTELQILISACNSLLAICTTKLSNKTID